MALLTRLAILTLSIMPATASSAAWESYPVPGALCGDGSPYVVHVRRGNPARIALVFHGGGACWDALTCGGPIPLTRLRGKAPAAKGFLSDDPAVSPVAGYTLVSFPYCTGDTHAGRHSADYGHGVRVRHWGAIDVELALRELPRAAGISLGDASELVVYGYSGGAIGAILNVRAVEAYLRPGQRRVAILDSPGLQWGPGFWKKFPPAMQADYGEALSRIGVPFDPSDGNLARHASEVCARFNGWTVGVLQGSRDVVMSLLFGGRSPFGFESDLMGPSGLWQATENPRDNCSSWVPRSFFHTFLFESWTGRLFRAGDVTAYDFAADLIDGRGGKSYRF